LCLIALFELLLLSLPQNLSSQVRDIFFGCCCAYSPFDLVSKKYRHFSSNASSLQAVQLRVQAATFMTGNLSVGKCVASDATVLDTFSICPHNCHIRYIIMVTWKAPSARWLKVNTDGSVVWSLGACGGLFRDHSALFLETLHLILERPMFSLLKFMVKFWLWSMQPVMVGETSS
jgi:hypothetical protein